LIGCVGAVLLAIPSNFYRTAVILGVHHGVTPKHLPRYLAEFCYRFNRDFWDPQMFNRMLHACVDNPTITFSELNA